MRLALVALGTMIAATSAIAAPPGERPATTSEAMGDAVTQPLSDVNLKRKGVPAELTAIRNHPYDLSGIRSCRQIIAEVTKLDRVLGDDVDRIEVDPQSRKRREAAAGITGGAIGSLIPFRALIREVSGARATQDDYREAIYAGVVRRSYLKGLGESKRCRAPGRPLNRLESAQEAASEVMEREKDAK